MIQNSASFKNQVVQLHGAITPDVVAYRLDAENFRESIPKDDNPLIWYGVYFINRSSQGIGNQHESKGSIMVMSSNFRVFSQRRRKEQGYLLLINRSFLPMRISPKFENILSLMKRGCGPFTLNTEQTRQLHDLFDKIIVELSSSYVFKNDLLAILLVQLVHFMIKNFASSFAFV